MFDRENQRLHWALSCDKYRIGLYPLMKFAGGGEGSTCWQYEFHPLIKT